MTGHHTSIAIATASMLLAAILLLMKRQSVLALAQRWAASSPRTCGSVVIPLVTVAVFCFASIAAPHMRESTVSPSGAEASLPGASPGATAMDALQTYAANIDEQIKPAPATVPASQQTALPGVDIMIERLRTRLEQQPGDAKGWKMLGWSYLNIDRPADAAAAYETALKLEPDDPETKRALEKISVSLRR